MKGGEGRSGIASRNQREGRGGQEDSTGTRRASFTHKAAICENPEGRDRRDGGGEPHRRRNRKRHREGVWWQEAGQASQKEGKETETSRVKDEREGGNGLCDSSILNEAKVVAKVAARELGRFEVAPHTRR